MKKIDRSEESPCITIVRTYTTFGGSGKSVYRADVRRGCIPYGETELCAAVRKRDGDGCRAGGAEGEDSR